MRTVYWINGVAKEIENWYSIPVEEIEGEHLCYMFDSVDLVNPFGLAKIPPVARISDVKHDWIKLDKSEVPSEFLAYLLISGYDI